MALFGNKKEDKKEKAVAPKTDEKDSVKKAVKSVSGESALSWVLRKPRITEKATVTPETSNAYVFDIDPRATKTDVKNAVTEIYKVTPIKVNVTKIVPKAVERRRARTVKRGFKSGGKKAYVYLKKGEKIEFV